MLQPTFDWDTFLLPTNGTASVLVGDIIGAKHLNHLSTCCRALFGFIIRYASVLVAEQSQIISKCYQLKSSAWITFSISPYTTFQSVSLKIVSAAI